jgi:uncharacterized protein
VDEQAPERGYVASAKQALVTARENLQSGDYVASINRSYYAIFYAANALLREKGLASSKHSGVIALFREHFVKTGIIEVEHSRAYGLALESRMESDYDVEEWPDKDLATRNLEGAEKFVARIEKELASYA